MPKDDGNFIADALQNLFQDVGFTYENFTDDQKRMAGFKNLWKKLYKVKSVISLITEPYSHWENLSEVGCNDPKWLFKKNDPPRAPQGGSGYIS